MAVYNLRFTADVSLTVDISGTSTEAAMRELVRWPEVQEMLTSRVLSFVPQGWSIEESGVKPEFVYKVSQCPLVKIES